MAGRAWPCSVGTWYWHCRCHSQMLCFWAWEGSREWAKCWARGAHMWQQDGDLALTIWTWTGRWKTSHFYIVLPFKYFSKRMCVEGGEMRRLGFLFDFLAYILLWHNLGLHMWIYQVGRLGLVGWVCHGCMEMHHFPVSSLERGSRSQRITTVECRGGGKCVDWILHLTIFGNKADVIFFLEN